MRKLLWLLLTLALARLAGDARADSTVVFNEIMYHPATDEPMFEWVELHNQMAVDMELSGWSLANGVEFTFPEGTVVPGGGYLVVALNPAALMAATGLTNVLGPFSGRLANNGERLELRNNNGRLMDVVTYGVEDDWPVAPDGAGPSLAKYDEDTASGHASNWRASEQNGGTPGAANFPRREITVTTVTPIVVDSTWRFHDTGADLGTAWREAAFDDGAWSFGAGLFHAGTGSGQPGQVEPIATLFSTGLDSNRNTILPGFTDPHYVLTASAYSTPPPPPIPATIVANHPNWLANDAASMWIGPVSQGTANVPPGGYTYRTTFDLTGYDPATAQITFDVAVDNDLTGVLLNGVSLGFTYSGFTAYSAPFTRTTGFVAGTNTLEFVTVNGGTSANPAGFRTRLSGTALKRSPTNTVLALGPVTHYFRKSFVLAGDPAATALRLRPVLDDGAVFYLNGVEVLRINLPGGAVSHATPASTNVVNANWIGPFDLPTGSLVTGTNVLAVEVHQAVGGATDVLFGAELTLTTTNFPPAPPPALAFNEISAVTNAQFWIEIVNHGATDLALGHFILARFGTTNREYVLPAQTLPAGGFLVLDRATLGFGADPGDRVVLYRPDRSGVVDALVAKSYPRARWPDGTGPWLHPTQATPGATNHVVFRDEIVINEIMYRHRALPAQAAVYFTNRLLVMTNVWRYNQTGQLPAPNWFAPDYDDSLWPTGRAAFHVPTYTGTLPVPKNTALSLSNAGVGIVTYYFRAPFVFTNPTDGLQLTLNHVVDDGAVFYLNGVEVWRYGMPAGTVNASTRAAYNIGAATNFGPVSLPVTNLIVGTNVLAVEVHQYLPPPGSRDVAFAADLLATGYLSPPLPARESPESWIELHNRSSNAVDLAGWRLTDGIEFQFASGTVIPAGGYLVVAKDVAYMQATYPGVPVVGPFTNQLSRASDHLVLRDPTGNPADELRYYDGKPWPGYADGLGSSLELRDPRADNSKPEAWAASDESGKSAWQTVTYRAVATAEPASSPTQWREFVMGLLGEGEVLLDDLSVIESPAGGRRQLLQNGSFETGLTAWRVLGNHRHSEVITDPTNPTNKVLRLVATGDTEHMHNHLETTFAGTAAVTNGVEYEISFRARWLAGCNKLNTRLYFNRVARTTELAAPTANGTPGARNSRYVPNLGPTFSNLRHEPVVPAATEPVRVSVEASDPDGVTNATLFYSVNGAAWQSVPMSLTASRLALQASALLPPQAAGSIVQFYVSATDGLGAAALYPPGGPNSRALYKVAISQALMPRLHTLRIIMTPADAAFLHYSTNVMSNERLGCTVISKDREVFYDAGVHLQGSERGRDNTTRVGFTVRLGADHRFRGVHRQFTVDRSGGYSGRGGDHDEILLKHAVNKAGGLPGMYDDLVQFFAPRPQEDSTGLLVMAKYGEVFLDSQFQNGSDGEMYKLELIYYPTTTVNGDPQAPKLPQPDTVLGTDIRDLGDDPEAYRWVFLKENHVARDNYAPLIGLAKAMSLTGPSFDAQIRQVMDVDEWLRAVAFLGLIGAGDMYTYGNSHNLLIYFRPEDGRGMAFLWDMDYAFVQAITTAFPGSGSANTYKLITTIPDNYRRYYNHLYELSRVTGDSTYMGAWAARYAGMLGQNWNGVVDYLVQRAAYVRSTMPLTTPFAILNNGGNNFATTNSTVTLSGSAPMTVRDVLVNGLRYAVTWTSLTNWTLTVPLPAYTNWLNAQGVDGHGAAVANATDSILVTNLGVPALAAVVINEWMADNAGPGGFPDPADGQFQDWFELFNPNDVPVNLSGYYLTDTLLVPNKWTIPTNTIIPARGFLLVWADEEGSQNGSGPFGDLHVNFKLAASGEVLGLFAPDGTPQHVVTFGPQFQNVSRGLFPDGDTNAVHSMTNWTPRAPNQLGGLPSPSLTEPLVLTNGSFSFAFPAVPNRVYRVDYKDELSAPFWTPLLTNRAPTDRIVVTDAMTGRGQRFYRTVLVP